MLVLVWLAVAGGAIYLALPEAVALRVVLALPLMLFIPGYCVIATLFPKEGDIDLMERFVLSFGLSIAIVPLLGLGLNFTPWGIRLEPILAAVILFTLVMVVVAYYARSRLPQDEQFRIHIGRAAGCSPGGICSRKKKQVRPDSWDSPCPGYPGNPCDGDLCDHGPPGRRPVHGIFHSGNEPDRGELPGQYHSGTGVSDVCRGGKS